VRIEASANPTPRRLAFGPVAELYDASRPSYPAELIDDVLELAPMTPAASHRRRGDPQILEVGAGTGKATTMFAARGVGVLAIEPSHEMAAVARRNCSSLRNVEVVESDFERWDPAGRRFPLLISAQAWHWIDRAVRFDRAYRVLAPGGLLAAFWNTPVWEPSQLRDDLKRTFAKIVPDLAPDSPMHPANNGSDEDDWQQEVADAGGFDGPAIRFYERSVDYTAQSFVDLLGTLSEIRLLDEDRRAELLGAVRERVEAHGGSLTMPMYTRLCLACRA